MNRKPKQRPSGPQGTKVEVYDNNIGQAMRRMKKILQSEGVFKEMRERQSFEKPSLTRKRKKAAARKRHLKELAKRNNI